MVPALFKRACTPPPTLKNFFTVIKANDGVKELAADNTQREEKLAVQPDSPQSEKTSADITVNNNTPIRRTTRSMKRKSEVKQAPEVKSTTPVALCDDEDDDIICVLDTKSSHKRKSQAKLSNFFSKKPKI